MSIKIKKEIIFRTELIEKSGVPNLGKKAFREIEHNQKGLVLKDITYDSNGYFDQIIENKYNEEGHLIEEAYYEDEDELTEKTTYERKDGKIIFANKHYADGSIDKIEYKFDLEKNIYQRISTDDDGEFAGMELLKIENEKLLEKEIYDEDKVLELKEAYKYEGELVIEESHWDHFENETIRTTYEYDDKGTLIKSLKYNGKDELFERTNYELDDNNLVIGYAVENPSGISKTVMGYDEKGNNNLQEQFNSQDQLAHRVERSFNEHAQIIDSEVFIANPGGGVQQHYRLDHEYDYYE